MLLGILDPFFYIPSIIFAVASFLSIGIENIVTRIHIIATIIFLCIIVLKYERFRKIFMRKYVKKSFKKSIIAVLDGTIDRYVGYNIPKVKYSSRDWKNQLEKNGLKVELIPVSEISKYYSMIINPFGGVYIEEDFSNKKTLNKIKNYIHEGGVFINVRDLAFWKSWNSKESTEGLTSPGVEAYVQRTRSITQNNQVYTYIQLDPIISGRSLIDTNLYKNYGVHTTTFGSSIPNLMARPVSDFLLDIGEKAITEFRAVLNCEKEGMNLHKLFSARLDHIVGKEMECYPVVAINYYIGYLVLFGIGITSDEEFDFECKIIEKIHDKLSLDGAL